MSRKTPRQSFDQILETLRTYGFAVAPCQGAANGQLVSKSGAAAILVPSSDASGGPVSFFERPGILLRGDVARLLDRGYQKFIKTHQYQLPARASLLHAIHTFSEELTTLIGGESSTTSRSGRRVTCTSMTVCAAAKTRFQRQSDRGNWQAATRACLADGRGELLAWQMIIEKATTIRAHCCQG